MSDVTKTIGERFTVAAEAAGLSREDLTRKVTATGMRNFQRYFEANPPKVPWQVVAQVAEATGISADYLLGLIPEPLPLDREAVRSPAGPVLPGNRRSGATSEDAPRTRATDPSTSSE